MPNSDTKQPNAKLQYKEAARKLEILMKPPPKLPNALRTQALTALTSFAYSTYFAYLHILHILHILHFCIFLYLAFSEYFAFSAYSAYSAYSKTVRVQHITLILYSEFHEAIHAKNV